ncbi:hypothetical protein ACF0H5_022551 [Mactra antiquata]
MIEKNTCMWIIFDVFVIRYVYSTGCHFHGDIAECVNTNLMEIPNIPGNIKELIFTGNNLGTVTNGTFKNVDNARKIWKLILTANRIVNISENAFKSFTKLTELELSFNKIKENDLKHLLRTISMTHHLYSLRMNNMGSKTINEETFSLLDKTPAFDLYLMNNNLETFTINTLSRLQGIKRLNLDNNHISEFKLTTIDTLEKLEISHNKLNTMPDFCVGNTSNSFTNKLNALFLNYNQITSIDNCSLKCLSTLNMLQLERNTITSYPTRFLSNCPHITVLDMRGNIGHYIKVFPLAFASNTLTVLNIAFDGNAMYIFQSLPNTF